MIVLRFEITPKQGEKGISEIIVGIGDPSKCCLLHGNRLPANSPRSGLLAT